MSRAREITALCCLALLVALLAPRPALAVKDSPVYTLDSLVYKSEAIVLGEVWDIRTVAKPARPLVIHRIRVLKTFFGQSLNQETIDIAELDGYHLAPGMTGIADSTRSFQTGDQLYLFLVSRNGGAGVGWVAISGGVRLLANDRVYAFRQYLGLWDGAGRLQVPMGDFAAVTPLSFPKAPEPLPQDVFEKKLESSRQRVAELSGLLAGEANIAHLERYRKAFNTHMRIGDNEGIDSLGEALASRLGEVAEPKAIDQLRQSSPPGISGAFGRCLQRAGCRPYLLARLSDGREPLALREQWSQILADSSWTYVREVAGRIGDAPREADLCQRMSAIATRNLGTTFSRTLITALGKTAEYGSAEHPLPPAIASDLQAAATELVLAYPRAQVLDRYRIAEALMLIGGDEYAKVHPSGGPLLTLVEPDTVSRTPAGPRDIRLMAHFRSLLSAQEVPVDLSLVLRHPGTGRETELKTNLSTERWAQSSGSTWLFGVTLPDELPRGKYDVFLRGRKGARLVGDGLGCQLDLPR